MAATTANKTGPNGDGQNGWAEYRRLVLAELERLSSQVAAAQAAGTANQLTLSQAITDAKTTVLEKLRDTIKGVEDDYEKKIKSIENAVERKFKDLEARYNKKIEDLKKEVDKNEKDFKEAETKREKNEKDVAGLKSKMMILGGVATLLVAIAAVVATIYAGK